MKVQFFATDSPKNKLYKNIRPIAEKDVKWKSETQITSPTIQLKYDETLLSSNYCYIEDFGRYYFINDIKLGMGNILEVSCSVDVLMSYADDIANISTIIDRQEYVFSPYFVDNQLLTRCERTVVKKNIGSIPTNGGYKIVLTVTNGGAESNI